MPPAATSALWPPALQTPWSQVLDRDRETGKEPGPRPLHFLTGARRPGSCPSRHPSAPEPLRKCQVPSKCPIQGPNSICPTEPASLPSKRKSPTGLMQVIKSAWRQSRGFRLSLRVPWAPTPSQEAQPPPSHTHLCLCIYTHRHRASTHVHAPYTMHTLHTHTFPFDCLPKAESSVHKDSGKHKTQTGLPKFT